MYVINYEKLKFYVKHGFVVNRLHRACEFKQSKWLGVYIEKTMLCGNKQTMISRKLFFKLTSNACFRKTIENLRKRSNLMFVSSARQAESFVGKASFKSFQVIKEKIVSVSFKMACVVWDKPTPVGAAILDLSKTFSLQIRLRSDDSSVNCGSIKTGIQRY